ncbi:hypothetical protein Tco_0815284 [Tanacetum coccineum]
MSPATRETLLLTLPNDLTKYLLAILVFSPLNNDQYMEIMQAYDATDNELPIPSLQAPIAPPTIVSLSPMFDSFEFPSSREFTTKDIETPANHPF